MAKKKLKTKNQALTVNGGLIFASPSTYPFSIIISASNSDEILKISNNGEIYYRHNNEMVKVNCPDELSQAFQECVLHMTGYNYEDVMINKYLEKILNHERSNEYITKLESAFRKLKLNKLKNII